MGTVRTLASKVAGVAGVLAAAVMLMPGGASAAASLQGSTLDFGQGGSKIWDNGDLRIATDDNLYVQAPLVSFSGRVDISKDLYAWYPIYAKGNLIKFGGDATTTLDFGRGGSKIWDTHNLTISTDDNLVIDAITLAVNKDLNVARNALFQGDVVFNETGGTQVKPDFRVDGYSRFDGMTEFDGDVLLDGTGFADLTIAGGNFKIGSATPGVTMDGNDAFIEGTLEVDGAATFDGNLTVNGTFSPAGITSLTSLTVGGGYGDTGATIAATGNISTNGTLVVDGTSTLTGASTHTGAASFDGGANPANAGDEALGTTALEWDGLYVGDDGVGVTFGADQDAKMTWDATAAAIEIESGLVSIGADPGGATATGAGDLIVSDALEVDGATDLDGTLNVAGVATLAGTSIHTGAASFDGGANPANAGDEALGTTALEWSALYLDDDTGINFGLDQDALLAYDEATDNRVELTGSGASLFVEDRIGLGRVTATNTAGAATDNLTPVASYYELDPDDTTDVVQLQTGSASEGDIVILANVDTTLNIAVDSTGTTKLDGGADVSLTPFDVMMLIFDGTNWLQVAKVAANS